MSSEFTEYYVQLIDQRKQQPIDDDSGKYIVMTVDTPTPATIYSSEEGATITYTAATSSNTITDGIIRFWTASSVASVDLTVHTAGGQAVFVKGLTPSQHHLDIDVELPHQISITPFYSQIASLTATASVWSTGMVLPANSVVKDVYMRITTLGTAAMFQAGVSTTPSGFLIGVTGSITGYTQPLQVPLSTTLLESFGLNLVASSTAGIRKNFFVAAATGIVFGDVTSTTLAAAGGYLYIVYDKIPV